MVERFIEISMYFCFRCSVTDSLTERTEESLPSAIFYSARPFVQQLSGDIPFFRSSLAGETLFRKLLIGQKIIFCSLKFCPSKWELFSLGITWTNFKSKDTILTAQLISSLQKML